jgi:hypothetical protein
VKLLVPFPQKREKIFVKVNYVMMGHGRWVSGRRERDAK